MKNDLRDLLDQPLAGEPAHRSPREHLERSRRLLRRRRAINSVVAVSTLATVTIVALSTTPGGLLFGRNNADIQVTNTNPIDGRAAISPEVRERYPVIATAADCMTARGFDVQVGRDGGIGYAATVQHEGPIRTALDECLDEADPGRDNFRQMSEWTGAEWRDVFRHERDVAACLRDHDVTIPSIPPFDDFVERYPTRSAWTAFQFVPNVGQERWSDLSWSCPQQMPLGQEPGRP